MILDDDIPEGDERFQLILTNPSPGLELGENTTGNWQFLIHSSLSLMFFYMERDVKGLESPDGFLCVEWQIF